MILRGGRRQISIPNHDGPPSAGIERQATAIVQERAREDARDIVARRVVDRQIIIRRSGGQVKGGVLPDHAVEGIVVFVRRIAERRGDRRVESDQRRLAARPVAVKTRLVVTVEGRTAIGWRRRWWRRRTDRYGQAIGDAAAGGVGKTFDDDGVDRRAGVGVDMRHIFVHQARLIIPRHRLAVQQQADAVILGQVGQRGADLLPRRNGRRVEVLPIEFGQAAGTERRLERAYPNGSSAGGTVVWLVSINCATGLGKGLTEA